MARSDLFRSLQVSLEIIKLNDRIFDWSGHHLSSIGHVPCGGMILLSMRSCYFVDHDLKLRDKEPLRTTLVVIIGLNTFLINTI